jgi:hypothetical protein
MGVIIMQVILAGQDSMAGFIISDSIMGIIILQPMLAGQDPIIP